MDEAVTPEPAGLRRVPYRGAGPGGGSDEKPVGLVYIAVAGGDGTVCLRGNWPGTRDQFKSRVSQYALNMLRKRLLGMEIEGTL